MVDKNEKLGQIIKDARLSAKLTREDLSEMTGLSVRYIAAIENEGKKPRFEILGILIRTLGIDANSVFYPDKENISDNKTHLRSMIDLCNEYELNIVSAVLKAILRK